MSIPLPREPRRILIVKPSALGDIVHTLPFLHLLRKRYKTAEISWLVVPAFAGLLEHHHLLDHVLLFERKRFANLWRDASAAKGLFHFAMSLRREQYDLVIDLQGLLRSGWITWQTRAPVRVGFSNAREGAPIFYTHRVPTDTPDKHAIERYVDIAEALDCGRGPVVFDFGITDEPRLAVRELLPDIERYCVLLPGTNWATKRWPMEKFARLVEPIESRFGLRCVIAGGCDVVELATQAPAAINLAGKTNLKELVALLDGASLVIANDSGPMHIASALNRPLVTLFGPTNPVRTGPYARPETVTRLQIACSPCYSRTCSHHSCMQWLEVEQVLADAALALHRVIDPAAGIRGPNEGAK
ncbi:MAG: lipopolysaccharide heptosyltransferase I [Burkholderiales bacterium]|nr:lipopolysaccharide heptosyltransferase I [Phycisphaerae bacterium]